MTGAFIDAASALWAGLVDEVVDADGEPVDVDPVACQLARDAVWIQECYDTDDPSRCVVDWLIVPSRPRVRRLSTSRRAVRCR